MPDFIVHTTAREYSEHQKRVSKKQLIGSLWAIVFGCIGFYAVYWLAWEYVH